MCVSVEAGENNIAGAACEKKRVYIYRCRGMFVNKRTYFLYMCVCECVCGGRGGYVYIYIYTRVYIVVCMRVHVFV